MTTLAFEDVSVTYDPETAAELEALDGVSFTVAEGESVAIIGPSGCGKSTLLSMATGMLKPSAGRVLIDGEEVTGARTQTALISQDLGLLPWKTVERNAELGLLLRGVDRDERRAVVAQSLAQVGLAGFEKSYPAELSGGMRQRLAFARALALGADLLLMDEPLSALDALSREALQQLLVDLQAERGYSSLLVTHSIDEAVFLGDRIVVMTPRPGRVAGIIENPGHGSARHRTSPEFADQVRAVRLLLEQAVGGDAA